MTKIAYNACYGGFDLSIEAAELYEKLSGRKLGRLMIGDRKYVSGAGGLERDDQYLIEVIETLGDKANTRVSKLAIKDIPEGTLYRIDGYDGYESVRTIDDYDWKIA